MNKQKKSFSSFIAWIRQLVFSNPSAISKATETEKDTLGDEKNICFPNRNEREFNRDHWPPNAPWF